MDLVSLFSEGARQYPPHPMEHAAMESKKHTINITIGFPFQHQQVPFPKKMSIPHVSIDDTLHYAFFGS